MRSLRILLVLLFLFGLGQARAQFDAHFGQYWALQSYYNPAGIGLSGKLNICGTYSAQMTGVTRSAKTMYFGADMPLVFLNNHHNIGLSFFNEGIGLFTNQRFSFQYAFRTKLLGGRIAGGVQLGLLSEGFDGSKVDFGDAEGSAESDPAFPSSEVNGSGFDIGAGLHYWHRYFSVGFAVSHLNSPEILLNETNEFQISPTYYFMGEGNIQLQNPLLSIQPSLLFQSDGVTWRADITGRLTYTNEGKKYYAGLGYSPDISCSVLLGCLFHGVNFGYSYELYTNAIGVANGNHNLFIGYQMDLDFFKKGKNKHKSVRIL